MNTENLRENVVAAVKHCGLGVELLDIISYDDNSHQAIVSATNPEAAKLAAVTAHMAIARAVNPAGWMEIQLHPTSEVPVITEDRCFASVVCGSTGEVLYFL